MRNIVIAGVIATALLALGSCGRHDQSTSLREQAKVVALAGEAVRAANRYDFARLVEMGWEKSSARFIMQNVAHPERHYRKSCPYWPSLRLAQRGAGVRSVRVYSVPPDSETAKSLFSWCLSRDAEVIQRSAMEGKFKGRVLLVSVEDSRGASFLPMVQENGCDWRLMADPGECTEDSLVGLSDLKWSDVPVSGSP